MIMEEPFTVSMPPSSRNSRSRVSTQFRDPDCQSSFISRDEILNGNAAASVSCSEGINETTFSLDRVCCEEDFISKSKTGAKSNDNWKFRLRESRNSSRSRTFVSHFTLSYYVAVMLLLLTCFANVSPSVVLYGDLCPNVTWSDSMRCDCSMYSMNASSCTNYSTFDDSIYSCSCGDNMVCNISVLLNSTDSEPVSGNCSCINNSTGPQCETPKMPLADDLCANVSCLNGATCRPDNSTDYRCDCPKGFTGTHCELNINDCNGPNICENNGTCVDGVDGYTCNCTEGYEGVNCSHPNCTNVMCHNGGVCDIIGARWSCNCSTTGYEGLHCETDINECNATNHCENNGTCLNIGGGYNCSCLSGYTGNRCESDINECDAIPDVCTNNGNCSNFYGGHNCTCFPSYSGTDCSNHDACYFNPCQNNGTCLNGTNTYNCSCTHGFMGVNCSEVDHCASSPCVNGMCQNANNSYKCSCAPGFTGGDCSKIDHCASYPCVNGTCRNLNDTYNCSCSNGFAGVNCDLDPCAENPCVNGECHPLFTTGDCSDTNLCYTCNCSANYTGVKCDTLIGSSSPSSDNNATIALIVGLTVGLFILLVIIVALILAIIVRNKRRNLGTYHPSRQEVNNARLEINGVLKPPPEERLI